MKETRLIMGMPVTLEVIDRNEFPDLLEPVFNYFKYIDEKFSTYKEFSEISLINNKLLTLEEISQDMRIVLSLADRIKEKTNGYFDIEHYGKYDPSGLVKGWAIFNASEIIRQIGIKDFYVEAGGDIQAIGKNSAGLDWHVGIRNPFKMDEIVKVISISNQGVATSGSYIRGQHIYNPMDQSIPDPEIVSITVIGPDIFLADCFATAAFAMGRSGIEFIENLTGFEAYMIDQNHVALYTSGFTRYVIHDKND